MCLKKIGSAVSLPESVLAGRIVRDFCFHGTNGFLALITARRAWYQLTAGESGDHLRSSRNQRRKALELARW